MALLPIITSRKRCSVFHRQGVGILRHFEAGRGHIGARRHHADRTARGHERRTGSGAGSASIVREPILAALGAGIPINAQSGNMIVNIGGGTSEQAVIALGNIVSWASLRVAGNKFDQAIMDYIKKKYGLAIGEQTAENVKIQIGSAMPMKEKMESRVRGRDLVTGLPKDIVITSNEIAEALNPLLIDIVASIRNVFNETPPELVADIMEKGIILSGGSVQLASFPNFWNAILVCRHMSPKIRSSASQKARASF